MRIFLALILPLTLAGCVTIGDVMVEGSDWQPARRSEGTVTGFINKTLSEDAAVQRYAVYVPHDYTPDREWPLIVFLHGAGERGNDGLKQTDVGIGRSIRFHPDWYPAIVLFPQCPEEAFWDVMLDELDEMIARTREEYRIDGSRITLTGLSMGGYGTWIWGATKTDLFAALMPICGGGNPLDMDHLTKGSIPECFGALPERVERLATVPIWAFHGGKDTVVPPLRTKQMVRLVEEAGGSVKYTEYPEAGHNSWDQAYGEEKAIGWLLKQRKE